MKAVSLAINNFEAADIKIEQNQAFDIKLMEILHYNCRCWITSKILKLVSRIRTINSSFRYYNYKDLKKKEPQEN